MAGDRYGEGYSPNPCGVCGSDDRLRAGASVEDVWLCPSCIDVANESARRAAANAEVVEREVRLSLLFNKYPELRVRRAVAKKAST